MKHATREIWVERVRGWRASGLSAEEYAANEGCNAHTLRNWRTKLGGANAMLAKAPSFVELVSPQRSKPRGEPMLSFEVTLPSGVRVVIPSRFDAAALEAILSVLEGGS